MKVSGRVREQSSPTLSETKDLCMPPKCFDPKSVLITSVKQ